MSRNKMTLYAIIGAFLVAFATLVTLFYFDKSGDTAPVLLPTPSASGGTIVSPGPSGSAGNNYTKVEVTTKTVQTAIATLERPESYSRVLYIESDWLSGKADFSVTVQQRSGYTKMTINWTGSDITKNIIVTPRKYFIWYNNSNEYYSGNLGNDSGEAADEYQMIMSYEDILKLKTEDIISAGYQTYAGEGCIFVETKSDELNYLERYYISVNSGLLVGAQTFDEGRLIYSQSSSSLDLTVPEESAYLLPDGNSALTNTAE